MVSHARKPLMLFAATCKTKGLHGGACTSQAIKNCLEFEHLDQLSCPFDQVSCAAA